jgi:hypothetical protein
VSRMLRVTRAQVAAMQKSFQIAVDAAKTIRRTCVSATVRPAPPSSTPPPPPPLLHPPPSSSSSSSFSSSSSCSSLSSAPQAPAGARAAAPNVSSCGLLPVAPRSLSPRPPEVEAAAAGARAAAALRFCTPGVPHRARQPEAGRLR